MPRKSFSTRAIRGSSVGSDKSNTPPSTSHTPTTSSSQDSSHSAARGQQNLLGIDGDTSKSTQTENLDESKDTTKTSKQDIGSLLLGYGAQFYEDLAKNRTEDITGTIVNNPTHQQPSSKSQSCTACTRLELFIADDEASPLLRTSNLTNNTTLEDNKINASRKCMGMRLKVLEREIQGREDD